MQIDMTALQTAVEEAMTPGAPAAVAVGDDVIAWNLSRPATYGGPDEHGSAFTMIIGIGTGSTTVQCPPDRVAPASTPLADPKDPRITVTKRKAPSWMGSWVLTLPDLPDSHHKLKRDAVIEGTRRLAIADWHAARKRHSPST